MTCQCPKCAYVADESAARETVTQASARAAAADLLDNSAAVWGLIKALPGIEADLRTVEDRIELAPCAPEQIETCPECQANHEIRRRLRKVLKHARAAIDRDTEQVRRQRNRS